MSDVKKEIVFHDSMTADKRNENFAYLRKNCLATITPGLYPSKDFYQERPTALTASIRNILGTDKDGYDIKIIAEEDGDVIFYNLGSDIESNSALSSEDYAASAFGVDGVYVATEDGKVHRVNHANSSTPEVGDFGSSWDPQLGAWDDVYYWWIDPDVGIYRQLPEENPVQIFNGSLASNSLRGVDFFGSYMVIFTQVGRDIITLWWDKADNSFFYRRIKTKNSIFLAGGVVDGRLMLIHFIGNSTNRKELGGEIVVSAWDGENFTRLNSIRAGTPNVEALSASSSRQVSFSTGAEVLEFAVDNNEDTDHNADLYQNYIYRVRNDGRIEVRAMPDFTDVSGDRASIVRVFHDFSLYTVGTPWKIMVNKDSDTEYDEYENFTTTEYITNFSGNPYNDHKLDGISISFEKIFQVDAPPLEPVPGSDGDMTLSGLGPNEMTLNWVKATSPYYPQAELEYKVYRSLSNNITTIADMIANGTMVQDWTENISSELVTGLSTTTTYYFNIIVRDPDGNESAYNPVSGTTTSAVTAWMTPTANFSVEVGAFPVDPWTNPANAYADDGSYAVASQGDQAFQCYSDFDFAVPGGATILGFEFRIKAKTTANPGGNARITLSPLKTATNPTEYNDKTATRTAGFLTGTDAYYVVGDSTDMMGTTWTPAEVNDPAFGIIVSGTSSTGPVETNYSLDVIEARVFYSI